jgi:hypothetical protein
MCGAQLLSVETVDEFLDRVVSPDLCCSELPLPSLREPHLSCMLAIRATLQERMQIDHDAFVAAGGGKFEVKEGSPFLLFDAK